jgi:hypothetical protein
MKIFLKLFVLILLQNFFYSSSLEAQATLSIQGILKRANGDAVDDGAYTITFRLYEQESGSTSNAIWTETQNDVDVFNGIYSAVLGQTTALNVPFDQLYYLGVTIGSSELSPRILLTSAPYALSLIGSTNQFPSSGQVLADSIIVNGGVKVTTGAPGSNGINQKGYSFTGDGDSGLFSTGDGNASIYSNNTEVLSVNPGAATVNGNFTTTGTFNTGSVNITAQGDVKYNGLSAWRLVDIDDFSNGYEGWNAYDQMAGEWIGWNQTNPNAPMTNPNLGPFAGNVIMSDNKDAVLKKLFNIPGSFSQIKVKFRYYLLDSWGYGLGDIAFAGFSSALNGSNFKIGWYSIPVHLNANVDLGTPAIREVLDFYDLESHTDHWIQGEMTAQANGNNFYVFIGAACEGAGTDNDENFAIGHVEIWVR